jgi:hypothetical protein
MCLKTSKSVENVERQERKQNKPIRAVTRSPNLHPTQLPREKGQERVKRRKEKKLPSERGDGQMKLHTDLYIYMLCTHQSWS